MRYMTERRDSDTGHISCPREYTGDWGELTSGSGKHGVLREHAGVGLSDPGRLPGGGGPKLSPEGRAGARQCGGAGDGCASGSGSCLGGLERRPHCWDMVRNKASQAPGAGS